jgi:hypothetical protein
VTHSNCFKPYTINLQPQVKRFIEFLGIIFYTCLSTIENFRPLIE